MFNTNVLAAGMKSALAEGGKGHRIIMVRNRWPAGGGAGPGRHAGDAAAGDPWPPWPNRLPPPCRVQLTTANCVVHLLQLESNLDEIAEQMNRCVTRNSNSTYHPSSFV